MGAKVTIELTDGQVNRVIRTARQEGSPSTLYAALIGSAWTETVGAVRDVYAQRSEDRRLSSSLLAGLMVLACFPRDGATVGLSDLAQKLGMSMSTTHRYVSTLTAAGLLEQDPDNRRYRMVTSR